MDNQSCIRSSVITDNIININPAIMYMIINLTVVCMCWNESASGVRVVWTVVTSDDLEYSLANVW